MSNDISKVRSFANEFLSDAEEVLKGIRTENSVIEDGIKIDIEYIETKHICS